MKLAAYVLKIKSELENLLGCPIDIVEDREISVPCKIEYAHNYARDRHIIRANPDRCANSYPIFSMMLLCKLQLQKLPDGKYGVLQPVTTPDEADKFDSDFKNDRVGQAMLAKYGAAQFDSIKNMLCAGLVTQCSTQVLELLASDVVVKEFPEAVEDMKKYLRPAAVEGAAMTYEQLLAVYPEFIVTVNRMLNLLFSMKCGEICGEKLVDAYKPTSDEIDKALDLYSFYRAERDALAKNGKIVGEVVKNIFKRLKVDKYAHLRVIEISPLNLPHEDDGLTDEQRDSLQNFYSNFGDGKSDSELMILGMFKVLRELRGMPLEVVKSLAIEIALLGANGISPTKKYTLKMLPNRGEIWGAEVLAYYYVTWAKVFPDKLDEIGLPYKSAYASAVSMLENLSQK